MKLKTTIGIGAAAIALVIAGYWIGRVHMAALYAPAPPSHGSPQPSLPPMAEQAVTDFGEITRQRSAESPWEYRRITDPLTGRGGDLACTMSRAPVRLRWPYDSHRALLCVRSSPRFGLDVFLTLPQGGQFDCRNEGCAAQIRVGEANPRGVLVTEPDDRTAAAIFLSDGDVADVVAALPNAHEAAVEAAFFEAGTQTLVFNTRNFEWPPAASDVAPGE